MIRLLAMPVLAFSYLTAGHFGYVPNPWGPAVGKLYEFNYDKADTEARHNFLFREANSVRSATNQKLAGRGEKITKFEVDAARHRVTFLWRYPRGMNVSKTSIRASTPRVLRLNCPIWSQSSLGRAKVAWQFSYRNVRNQEVGSVLLNPGTCFKYI